MNAHYEISLYELCAGFRRAACPLLAGGVSLFLFTHDFGLSTDACFFSVMILVSHRMHDFQIFRFFWGLNEPLEATATGRVPVGEPLEDLEVSCQVAWLLQRSWLTCTDPSA